MHPDSRSELPHLVSCAFCFCRPTGRSRLSALFLECCRVFSAASKTKANFNFVIFLRKELLIESEILDEEKSESFNLTPSFLRSKK